MAASLKLEAQSPNSAGQGSDTAQQQLYGSYPTEKGWKTGILVHQAPAPLTDNPGTCRRPVGRAAMEAIVTNPFRFHRLWFRERNAPVYIVTLLPRQGAHWQPQSAECVSSARQQKLRWATNQGLFRMLSYVPVLNQLRVVSWLDSGLWDCCRCWRNSRSHCAWNALSSA